jgi:hypothetical protein
MKEMLPMLLIPERRTLVVLRTKEGLRLKRRRVNVSPAIGLDTMLENAPSRRILPIVTTTTTTEGMGIEEMTNPKERGRLTLKETIHLLKGPEIPGMRSLMLLIKEMSIF